MAIIGAIMAIIGAIFAKIESNNSQTERERHTHYSLIPKRKHMKYVLKKQTKTALPSAGKYVARAAHLQTVTNEMIEEEVQENCTLKRSDVKAVLTELADTLRRHLQRGDIVTLDQIGRLKLEIIGQPVEEKGEFNPQEHINGVRLHIIPQSKNGKPWLYQDIRYQELDIKGKTAI